jgi:hypothetical protein
MRSSELAGKAEVSQPCEQPCEQLAGGEAFER